MIFNCLMTIVLWLLLSVGLFALTVLVITTIFAVVDYLINGMREVTERETDTIIKVSIFVGVVGSLLIILL